MQAAGMRPAAEIQFRGPGATEAFCLTILKLKF